MMGMKQTTNQVIPHDTEMIKLYLGIKPICIKKMMKTKYTDKIKPNLRSVKSIDFS